MTEPLVQCAAWLGAYFHEPAALEELPVPALHHPIFQQGQYLGRLAVFGSGGLTSQLRLPTTLTWRFRIVWTEAACGRTERIGERSLHPFQVVVLVLARGHVILGKGNTNDPCRSAPDSRWLKGLHGNTSEWQLSFSISLL